MKGGLRLLGAKGHGSAVGCGLLAQAGCVEGLCSLALRGRQRLRR